MPADAPLAAGEPKSLQFSDVASCEAWLARLPLVNPVQLHAALATQSRLLVAAAIGPAVKFRLWELLRGPVAAAQAEMAKNCRGKPLPLDSDGRKIWEEVTGLWRTVASGYDTLIDAMASTAPELATEAQVICQRALRYTALALVEYCHIYHVPSGELWRQLHRLYVFSENAGLAKAVVSDDVGRSSATTSCGGTYVHALLMHLAQPDALTSEELDRVHLWLEKWEELVVLSPDPLPKSAIPSVAVNLSSEKGAGPASQMPAAGVRHLNLEALSKALRQAEAALKQQTPAQLGLGDVSREACDKLLRLLHIQWCAAGTGRADERTPASIRVMISPNLASMHFHLTGKAFRQPGKELTAAERQRLDMFGSVSEAGEQALASQRSAALETWVIVNQSVSGFLGTAREKEVVSRISHHQLVALQPPARKVMYLGIVQRLNVDEAGLMWIGLRIILGSPQAAAVRPVEPVGAQYERALLMPEDTARKIPASIIMVPGTYQSGRSLGLHVEKERERRVKLQALLDAGANFERATYAAA
jgi:cyclic-di-GMP-binding protein